MAHNIALSENPSTPGEIGRLTINSTAQSSPTGRVTTLKVSRVRGGLRFTPESGPGTHVHGEDLYALRAMLAEVPEELFVEPKPADPARWTEGDEVTSKLLPFVPEYINDGTRALWTRGESVWTLAFGGSNWSKAVTDNDIERVLADKTNQDARILTQASGQDI